MAEAEGEAVEAAEAVVDGRRRKRGSMLPVG